MASIRLFGRGRNDAAPALGGVARTGPGEIAAVLADLTTAATSTTWRCRHADTVIYGEGSVDFAARRSHTTALRGKATFDYFRDGASVYRAPLAPDGEASAWQTYSEVDPCGTHCYADPAVLAQAVRAAAGAQPGKPEEFDGATLTGYSVAVKPKPADPDKLLARLARQLRDHGANTVILTAFVDETAAGRSGDPDAPEPPRIVRLRLELPHWTPADDPTADHRVTLDLFDLNEPVEIEPPDPQSATRRTSRSCADYALF